MKIQIGLLKQSDVWGQFCAQEGVPSDVVEGVDDPGLQVVVDERLERRKHPPSARGRPSRRRFRRDRERRAPPSLGSPTASPTR